MHWVEQLRSRADEAEPTWNATCQKLLMGVWFIECCALTLDQTTLAESNLKSTLMACINVAIRTQHASPKLLNILGAINWKQDDKPKMLMFFRVAWKYCPPLDPIFCPLFWRLQKTIINRKPGEEFELVEWGCFTFHALEFSHCSISWSLRESVNMSHAPARTLCARSGTRLDWISFQNWL